MSGKAGGGGGGHKNVRMSEEKEGGKVFMEK